MRGRRSALLSRDLSADAHARIRFQIALIPVYVVLSVGWWTLIGHLPFGEIGPESGMVRDFAHFYVQGVIARAGDASALYDQMAHAAWLKRVIPGHPDLSFPPVYGPQVSLLFAPLAWLPYEAAMYVWMVATVAAYGLCCWVVWRHCAHLRHCPWLVALLAAGAPALRFTLAFAQASAVGLLCMTGAYCALRAKRPFLAGVAFGALAYKPTLGIAICVTVVAAAEWRIFAGSALSAIGQITVGCLFWGWPIVGAYASALRRLPELAAGMEPHKYHMHSWRAVFELAGFTSSAALAAYAAVSVPILWLVVRCWRSGGPVDLRFAALSIACVLVDPHMYVYDLLVLTPALLVLWNWGMAQPPVPVGERFQAMARGLAGAWSFPRTFIALLYLCYLLPLMGGIVTATRVQLTVLLLSLVLWILWGVTEVHVTARFRSSDKFVP